MVDKLAVVDLGKSAISRISRSALGLNGISFLSRLRKTSSFQFAPELALVDQMPVGLAIYDLDGALAHANGYFGRLVSTVQLPSRPQRGTPRWQGRNSDGSELALRDFPCERALHGEIVSPGVDLLYLGEDGAGRWLNVSASPIRDPDGGTIVGIVLLFLDTHDRVQSSACAAQAGSRFRQFAENSTSAIWIADAVTREFTYRNPGHRLLTGDTAAVSALADWIDLVDEADRGAVIGHHDRVIAGGTGQREYRLLRDGGGAVRIVRETSFPIRDDAGAVTMIGGIIEDISPAADRRLFLIGEASGPSPLADAVRRLDGYSIKDFRLLGDFAAVARFLAFGCVVIDLASTPHTEDELLRTIADISETLPVVVVGQADTRTDAAIAAMRAGAADYLLPPFSDADLSDTLLRAIARIQASGREQQAVATPDLHADRIAGLSARERDVLKGLKSGGTNKSIGRDLGISPRTVEAHRSRLMERMNARSLAELLQSVP